MLTSQLMGKDDLILVTGGGGFIGGHLVAGLLVQQQEDQRNAQLDEQQPQRAAGDPQLRPVESAPTARHVANIASRGTIGA